MFLSLFSIMQDSEGSRIKESGESNEICDPTIQRKSGLSAVVSADSGGYRVGDLSIQ